MENALEKQFYLNPSVTDVAKNLLGKIIYSCFDHQLTAGLIVETEAYSGRNDKACHANNGRRTRRNEVMYAEGGLAYVYFCYGIHSMFNVVTNTKNYADAVLIRAIEPLEGVETMMSRRGLKNSDRVGSGPGNVCKALGIKLEHNTMDLSGNLLRIENGIHLTPDNIVARPRIGVDYAEEDALLLWRFYIKNNKWISKK